MLINETEAYDWISEKGVHGWMTRLESRAHFLCAKSVPLGGKIVEIGSYHGASSIVLAAGSVAGNRVPVYAVDPHIGQIYTNSGDTYDSTDQTTWYSNVVISGLAQLICAIKLPSVNAARAFDDESVDLLYIDGCHFYEAVAADLAAWIRVLRPGALVLMHDRLEHGVERAIKDRPSGYIKVGYIDGLAVLANYWIGKHWPLDKIEGLIRWE